MRLPQPTRTGRLSQVAVCEGVNFYCSWGLKKNHKCAGPLTILLVSLLPCCMIRRTNVHLINCDEIKAPDFPRTDRRDAALLLGSHRTRSRGVRRDGACRRRRRQGAHASYMVAVVAASCLSCVPCDSGRRGTAVVRTKHDKRREGNENKKKTEFHHNALTRAGAGGRSLLTGASSVRLSFARCARCLCARGGGGGVTGAKPDGRRYWTQPEEESSVFARALYSPPAVGPA